MEGMKVAHRAVQRPSLQMNTRRSLVIAATFGALPVDFRVGAGAGASY